VSPGFEGGQMPLQRRIPKKGFSNAPFKVRYNVVHVKDLARLKAGSLVTAELLHATGLVKKRGPIKLLADGDVSGAYTVKLDKVSGQARSKIEAAGGTIEEL